MFPNGNKETWVSSMHLFLCRFLSTTDDIYSTIEKTTVAKPHPVMDYANYHLLVGTFDLRTPVNI